jgi:hypothetical protein
MSVEFESLGAVVACRDHHDSKDVCSFEQDYT